MSKQEKQQQTVQQPGNQTGAAQQRPMRFVEQDIKTQYAGLFNVGMGMDEVMLLFCNPSVDPGVIKVESKVAMSMKNAKRLALTLGKLLSQYEASHGAIDISAPQQATGEEKIFPEL